MIIQKGSDMRTLKKTIKIAKSIDLIFKEDQKAWFIKTIEDLKQNSIEYQLWNAIAKINFDE